MGGIQSNSSYTNRLNSSMYNFPDKTSLEAKDLERHLSFFNSLDRKSKKGSVLGIVTAIAIMVLAAGTGIILNNRNIGTEPISAAECGVYEIRMADDNGFYCKPCNPGGYGNLDKCEEDSPTGLCTQDGAGCFIPLL